MGWKRKSIGWKRKPLERKRKSTERKRKRHRGSQKIAWLEKKTHRLEKKTAGLGKKTLRTDKQFADCACHASGVRNQLSSSPYPTFEQAAMTADCGHQLSSRDCLTLGLVNQRRPTVNHTVGADKKLTNRATHTKRPRQPTQYAHNHKPLQPKHKPKLAIESAATAPNFPAVQPDSTPDEKRHPVTWGLRYCGCSSSANCITSFLLLSWWTLLCF